MKYKALWKDTFREIPKSIMRFLAILIIIFLGVGFFVGLSATSPNMVRTVDEYFDDYNLMDFKIQSTYGLTDKDMQTLGEMDGVSTQSQYAYDFYLDEQNQSIRLYSYDAENGQEMNQYRLAEGRLPEASGEIALDTRDSFLRGVGIGDTLTFENGEENGSPEDYLTQQTFTVVGFVDTPLYITTSARGYTTIGSGSLDGFGVILESDYDTEFYSEASLTVSGSEQHQTFSDEYEDFIDPYDEQLTNTLTQLESQRAETIQEEAQAEIDDGWADIEEAEQALIDAEQELADARVELDNGWAEYQEGREAFETEIADAEAEINQNEAELDQTISDLGAQRQDLINQRGELQTQLDELNAAEPELISGIEQVEEGINQINAGLGEIDAQRPTLEDGLQELEAQEARLLDSQTQLIQAQEVLNQLDARIEQLEAELNNPEADLAQIEAELAGLRAQRQLIEQELGFPSEQIGQQLVQIEQGLNEITANRESINQTFEQEQALLSQREALENQLTELNSQREQMEAGRAQLIDGIQQISDGLVQLEDGLAQANAGYDAIAETRETLATESANAEAELEDAEAELTDGEAEYADGLATFEEEQESALDEIADGRADLEQAEQDLADLPIPEYFATRQSENSEYMEYKDNADRLSIIAAVFPVFFFLIAIFISFTTMTRMVDEEREFIGIMKALGYPNHLILTKFITYSVIATTIGGLLGLAVGYTLIPQLIFYAYAAMYNLPELHIQQYTVYTTIALLAAFASTVGASLLAVRHSLRSNAATLLQPKAPKKGTHIWLENIPFIWEKLSFNYKITFRNVFRYKSRMFMTIFGIAGSTGLIVTGFGISDSISTIPDTQYNELNHFQAYVALNTNADEDALANYVEDVEANEQINDSILTLQETVAIEKEGVNTQEATVFVPNDPSQLDEFVTLKHFETGESFDFNDSGAYITQKLARLFDVEEGDEMPIQSTDDEEWTIEVAGIVENYVGHTIYMTPSYYEQVTGTNEIEPSLQLIKYDTETVNQEELGRTLMDQDEVVGITYATDVYESFSHTLNSLELITQILVIAAGALAFIVLYNLTNINVSERERELSTIKVLGFHDLEVTLYIYRENILLTILGMFFGCLFGTVLQRFIMTTMEVDMLVFGKVVHPSSYIYSILLTILFSIIVMVVIHYQLKRIDMVEALKAND